MTIPFIDLRTQYLAIQNEIQSGINSVLEHGQYIMGPEVNQVERRLSEFTQAKYCITVASGTEALLISLMALGIGPGDEVITTPFSFIATAETIVLVGATPIFVDIESDTCNIDVSKIEEKITKNTKAIVPVSLYGQPSDMAEINAIAKKYGDIPVIEDAAQSFGAFYSANRSCNLSTIGCTSFFPSKPLGCYGDGGAIFTNDPEIAEACAEIRVHGQSQRYIHTRIGVGGRMDTMQCAVLLAKLGRFDYELERRSAVGQRYNRMIDEAGVRRIQQRNDRTSVYAQYTVKVTNRKAVQELLKDKGIPTAVHYPIPINQQPAYSKYQQILTTPVAEAVSHEVMSLPMSPDLSERDQDTIIAALAEAIKSN